MVLVATVDPFAVKATLMGLTSDGSPSSRINDDRHDPVRLRSSEAINQYSRDRSDHEASAEVHQPLPAKPKATELAAAFARSRRCGSSVGIAVSLISFVSFVAPNTVRS